MLLLLLLIHVLCGIIGARPTADLKNDRCASLQYQGNLSAFQRITLGLPVSINTEEAEGLTAVPGIGPKIASSIILERERRGVYMSLGDLRSINGIGPALLKKIGPYLSL